MNAVNLKKAVSDLNINVHEVFGLPVHFIRAEENRPEMQNTIETIKRNSGAPMIVTNDQLLVPVRIEGQLVGATCVGGIHRINAKQLSDIKAAIDKIFAEAGAHFGQPQITDAQQIDDEMDRVLARVISFTDRRNVH